jgi:IS30 family transposase
MLTVNRLGLPAQLRRSLACTNSIENMMGTVRRVCRKVKRWQNLNTRPRKTLGFETPVDMLAKAVALTG